MLTATGLRRSELGAHGRKLVHCEGKQILVIGQQDRLFAIAETDLAELVDQHGRVRERGLAQQPLQECRLARGSPVERLGA